MVVARTLEHDSRGSPMSDQCRVGRAARRRARLRGTLRAIRRQDADLEGRHQEHSEQQGHSHHDTLQFFIAA
jgi:hypothetical protein